MSAAQHFDRAAERFEALATSRPEFVERFVLFQTLIDAVLPQDPVGTTAIDIGCGAGHLSAFLADRGLVTVGIDGSSSMLALAAERTLPCSRQNVRFVHAQLPLESSLDLPPAQIVVMSSVLEYLQDDQAMLEQIYRMLDPGGRLIASFPNGRSVYWRIYRAVSRLQIRASSDASQQRHLYSANELQSRLETVGFEMETLRYFGLPLQRYWPRRYRRRPRIVATMFVCVLRRPIPEPK